VAELPPGRRIVKARGARRTGRRAQWTLPLLAPGGRFERTLVARAGQRVARRARRAPRHCRNVLPTNARLRLRLLGERPAPRFTG
jgi:hypothetical protein